MILLRKYRRKRKMSQSELAKKTGVSQATISDWESGETLPRTDKLLPLAEALDCTVDELLRNNKQGKAASG